ncbi:hypothetical protein [Amycolatopsis sp. NPDC058986]|uniref:hypothetical protein n=1 Tax=unclassified Amycolatopsis TaxID=2618356 RepID=UPI003671CC17
MLALSSGGIGLVLVAVTMLVVAGVVTLALLKKVLDSPERDVRVRVAVFPRPRIEIDAKAASGGVDKI